MRGPEPVPLSLLRVRREGSSPTFELVSLRCMTHESPKRAWQPPSVPLITQSTLPPLSSPDTVPKAQHPHRRPVAVPALSRGTSIAIGGLGTDYLYASSAWLLFKGERRGRLPVVQRTCSPLLTLRSRCSGSYARSLLVRSVCLLDSVAVTTRGRGSCHVPLQSQSATISSFPPSLHKQSFSIVGIFSKSTNRPVCLAQDSAGNTMPAPGL